MFMLFYVDPDEYTGIKVLAVPRCCQKRRDTQDRGRVNDGVAYQDVELREAVGRDDRRERGLVDCDLIQTLE